MLIYAGSPTFYAKNESAERRIALPIRSVFLIAAALDQLDVEHAGRGLQGRGELWRDLVAIR